MYVFLLIFSSSYRLSFIKILTMRNIKVLLNSSVLDPSTMKVKEFFSILFNSVVN